VDFEHRGPRKRQAATSEAIDFLVATIAMSAGSPMTALDSSAAQGTLGAEVSRAGLEIRIARRRDP
jgi:hypothetical protein